MDLKRRYVLLTELGTMDIHTHYQLCKVSPTLLAGRGCCNWHKQMAARLKAEKELFQ